MDFAIIRIEFRPISRGKTFMPFLLLHPCLSVVNFLLAPGGGDGQRDGN
jgi:hypothetical protein